MYRSEYSPNALDVNSKKIPRFTSYFSSDLPLKKEFKKKDNLSIKTLSLSTPSAQDEELLLDLHYTQARQSISQIKDPLWRHVCCELIKVLGPLSILKIWESRLGDFSAREPHMEIHCKNKDVAQFVQQYAFVILGSLQHYFPSVKNLEVKIA